MCIRIVYTQEDDFGAPSFLFESVVNGDQQGRYSFVGAMPALEVQGRTDESGDSQGGHTFPPQFMMATTFIKAGWTAFFLAFWLTLPYLLFPPYGGKECCCKS
eukprot:1158836-Pelagomonas_calceolata.AAC.2